MAISTFLKNCLVVLKQLVYFRFMKIGKIYTLTNPLTGQLFYVGATVSDLNKRLSQHRWHTNNETCNLLRSLKVSPIIELLDECDESEIGECEQFWITQLSYWGFALENKFVNKAIYYQNKNQKA